jgi:outer membrane protein TolC
MKKESVKMKTLVIPIFVFLALNLPAYPQNSRITLTECVDSALKNKVDIQAVRVDKLIAQLQTKENYTGYVPRISLGYDFRYNIVIPSQIVPVGQFNPIPTDEMRAIRFGTKWQQNAGLSLYQPLLDLSVKSHIAESRINEKLKNSDLKKAEQDLKSEVIRSFANVWLRQREKVTSESDTVRTYKTLMLLEAGSEEGRVQKTDLNRALISHNRALTAFGSAQSELAKEKIYLSFLTGLPLKKLDESDFDFSVFEAGILPEDIAEVSFDSLPAIEQLKLNAELSLQQIRTEKNARMPVAGVEAFAGANQYSNSFEPFVADSWYGNSYVGLTVKLPLTGDLNIRNRISQLRLREEGLRSRLTDEKNRIINNLLRLKEEIARLREDVRIAETNKGLLEENLALSQERYSSGQITSYDLADQELDLNQEAASLRETRTRMINKQLELLQETGMTDVFLDRIRR